MLRIVSLNADNTNRGHAFDMDMADLEKDGKPLPYLEARATFRTDPSKRYSTLLQSHGLLRFKKSLNGN